MPRNLLVGPLRLLLESTRFLVAIIALGVGILVSQQPMFEPVMSEILLLIGVLAMVIIHGYSIADASQYMTNNEDAKQWVEIGLEYDQSPEWIRNLIKEIVEEVSSGDNASPPSPI